MRKPNDYHPLDPRTLGRPVHLLHNFVGPFRDDLTEVFRTTLNRRYRASFAVGEVSLNRLLAVPERRNWRSHTDELGRVGFAIDRQLLLCILDYRYGGSTVPGTGENADPRETATEERLASMLGRQFVGALSERIECLSASATSQPCAHTFSETPGIPPRVGVWALRAVVSEASRGVEGTLWFTLDEAWMERLLARLAPLRDANQRRLAGTAPLASRLQLTLTARLLEKEVLLGQLLDLQPGDLIPVRLGLTDVLIDDSRLFTARVAEHQGKHCLTAFETIE